MGSRHLPSSTRPDAAAKAIHRCTVATVVLLVAWLSFEVTRPNTVVGSGHQMQVPRYLDEVTSIFEGGDYEHDHDEEQSSDNAKPWLEGIVAALSINFASLIGVVVVAISASVVHHRAKCCKASTALGLILPSLSIGALLATTVFLILPQALHLIEKEKDSDDEGRRVLVLDGVRYLAVEGHEAHSAEWSAWRFGTAILGGFVLPFFLQSFFPHKEKWVEDPLWSEKQMEETEREIDSSVVSETADHADEERGRVIVKVSAEPAFVDERATTDTSRQIAVVMPHEGYSDDDDATEEIGEKPNWKLAWTILIGDAIHNFVDGILVGNAFLLCHGRTTVLICITTFLQEFTEAIADFALLTNQCGLSVGTALEANFLSGMSILLGVVIIIGIDHVSSTSTGAILATSAGVYIYLAGVEIFPIVLRQTTTFHLRMLSMSCFTIGAIPVGLALLNHVHCDD